MHNADGAKLLINALDYNLKNKSTVLLSKQKKSVYTTYPVLTCDGGPNGK